MYLFSLFIASKDGIEIISHFAILVLLFHVTTFQIKSFCRPILSTYNTWSGICLDHLKLELQCNRFRVRNIALVFLLHDGKILQTMPSLMIDSNIYHPEYCKVSN